MVSINKELIVRMAVVSVIDEITHKLDQMSGENEGYITFSAKKAAQFYFDGHAFNKQKI